MTLAIVVGIVGVLAGICVGVMVGGFVAGSARPTGGVVTPPMPVLGGEPSWNEMYVPLPYVSPRRKALDDLTREVYEAGLYSVVTEPEKE